jgi:hypothetical protein
MAKKERNILEKVEKIPCNLCRKSRHRHCDAQSEQWFASSIYRLSILVSLDVSQPIQKIIGIGYHMSADTIKHIFLISCTMSADTNNVSGIRGVIHQRKTLTRGEILVCAVRLLDFPAHYAAASLYAAPSTPPPMVLPPPPSTPRRRCRRHQPHPWATLPSASTPPVVSPSSSPTSSPLLSLTPSHRPRLLL